MSFYSDEIKKINKALYPHDDLTKKITAAKLYIDKHFPDKVSLDEMARKAYVSKFHFIRLFKKYYGRTPNQYLQVVRIENAKKLLQKGKSIDDVCSAIGFISKPSFINLFKRLTGQTPFLYQKRKTQR